MSSLEIAPALPVTNDPLVVVRVVLGRGNKVVFAQRERTGEWHIPGGKTDGLDLCTAGSLEVGQEVGVGGLTWQSPFVGFEQRIMPGPPPYGGREYVGYCALAGWARGTPRPLDETEDVMLIEPRRAIRQLPNIRPDTPKILSALGLL